MAVQGEGTCQSSPRRSRSGEEEAERPALALEVTWSLPGRVPLVRAVLLREPHSRQDTTVARTKSSSALEPNEDIVLGGSSLHGVNTLYSLTNPRSYPRYSGHHPLMTHLPASPQD